MSNALTSRTKATNIQGASASTTTKGIVLAALMLITTALPFASEVYKSGVRNVEGWSYSTTTKHTILLFTPVGAVVFPLLCAGYALLFRKRMKLATLPALLLLLVAGLAAISNYQEIQKAKTPQTAWPSDPFRGEPIASTERQPPPVAYGAIAGSLVALYAGFESLRLRRTKKEEADDGETPPRNIAGES